ncbi:MAG: Wadjet anti-phage system protein JetA family protein, partial [Mobilitalea sp.]
LLRTISEDDNRLNLLKNKMEATGKKKEDVENEFLDIIDEIERGIHNMEKRITHIDTEHSKYIRATVSRLEYLLSSDDSLQGNVVTILNLLSRDRDNELYSKVMDSIQVNDPTLISPDSLYKKRGRRKVFEDTVEAELDTEEDLSKEDILRINRNKNRYSKTQIEQYVIGQMNQGIFQTTEQTIRSDEEFELLILAYDYSIRKTSPFHVVPGERGVISNDRYTYPDIIFRKNSVSSERIS